MADTIKEKEYFWKHEKLSLKQMIERSGRSWKDYLKRKKLQKKIKNNLQLWIINTMFKV